MSGDGRDVIYGRSGGYLKYLDFLLACKIHQTISRFAKINFKVQQSNNKGKIYVVLDGRFQKNIDEIIDFIPPRKWFL